MVAEIRTALMQDLRRNVTKRILDHIRDEPEAEWLPHLQAFYGVDIEGLRNNDADILLAMIQLTDAQMRKVEDDIDDFLNPTSDRAYDLQHIAGKGA